MEFICDFARCITITIVIITIVEMLVPEGEIKKIVLFVTGIVASATIAIPVLSLFSNDFDMEEVFKLEDYIAESEFAFPQNKIRANQIKLIEEEYASRLITETNSYYGRDIIKACRVYLNTDLEDKIEDIDKVIVTINDGKVEELKRNINRICEIPINKIDVVEEE